MVCEHCNKNKCLWERYEDRVMTSYYNDVEETITNNGTIDEINSRKRKALYKLYTWFRFGRLGKGNRKVLPQCVKDGIRYHFPGSNNDYMGHMATLIILTE